MHQATAFNLELGKVSESRKVWESDCFEPSKREQENDVTANCAGPIDFVPSVKIGQRKDHLSGINGFFFLNFLRTVRFSVPRRSSTAVRNHRAEGLRVGTKSAQLVFD